MIFRHAIIYFSMLVFAFLECDAAIRLALFSEPALAKESNLLLVELSLFYEDLLLLEREDIDKIIAEQELSFGPGNAVAHIEAGKLLNADVVVILSSRNIDEAEHLVTRIVAVESGVILNEIIFPNNNMGRGEAIVYIAHRIRHYSMKAESIASKSAVLLSVTGLRMDVRSSEVSDEERAINTLLISRLSHEDNFIVLDRENMEKLTWEKSLSVDRLTEFLSGSYLIGGTIHRNGQGELEVRVSLESADRVSSADIVYSGSEDDLDKFIDGLVTEINKSIGSKVSQEPWDPLKEAGVYYDLARWAVKISSSELAIPAAESVIALGLRNEYSEMLRVDAYAARAPVRIWSSSSFTNGVYSPSKAIPITVPELLPHFEHWTRTLQMLKSYIVTYETALNKRRISSLIMKALYVVAVAHYYTAHEQQEINREIDYLRKLCREVDALIPQDSDAGLPYTVLHNFKCAGIWYDTPEETLRAWDKFLHAQYVNVDLRLSNSADFRGGIWPVIAGWDMASMRERTELWKKHIDDMIKSDDVLRRALGFIAKYQATRYRVDEYQRGEYSLYYLNGVEKNAFARAMDEFFWAHREEIIKLNAYSLCAEYIFHTTKTSESESGFMSLGKDNKQFLFYFLENADILDSPMFNFFTSRIRLYSRKDENLSRELLAFFKKRNDKYGKNRYIASLQKNILEYHPQLVEQVQEEAEEFEGYTIRHYWTPKPHDIIQAATNNRYGRNHYGDGFLWVRCSDQNLYVVVDLVTFDEFFFEWPVEYVTKDLNGIQSIAINPNHFVVSHGLRVYSYVFDTGAWEGKELPMNEYMAYSIGDRVCLLYGTLGFDKQYGLLELDPRELLYTTLFITHKSPFNIVADISG